MTYQPITLDEPPPSPAEHHAREWREAGSTLGASCTGIKPKGRARTPRIHRRDRLRALIAGAAAQPQSENAAWLLDNFRLILGAEKEVREFAHAARELRAASTANGTATPLVSVLARHYLHTGEYGFREQDFVAFLHGYQQKAELEMGELWALKPALQLELIDRLVEAPPRDWPVLLTSLRRIGETAWKDIFESVSCVHRVLCDDPAAAFSRMDFDSRDRYCKALVDLARHSRHPELAIAEQAVALCRQARDASDGSRAAWRRTHVGYYLVDAGRRQLEAIIGYRPPWSAQIPRFILRHPTACYLAGIELITLVIVFAILVRSGSFLPAYVGLLLLLLPATQAAADFINNLATFLIPPRVLPKLDFSEGVPDDCVTMVAVPTLLLNEAQVHDLVLDLEIRFLANRDRNLYFALLTDPPDSDRPLDQHDSLVDLCARLIEGLNSRYAAEGRSPFFLFHRHRRYNHAEGRWMGWERKRGKLMDLNQLLRGGFDAFPVKTGDLTVLSEVRYVITLDSDTQLPRDSAVKLIGCIAHPLNQAVVHPGTHMVVEGYGILQPRIGISVQSRLAQPPGRALLRPDRIRHLHACRLRCLPGPVRRRHLHRQRYLRSRYASRNARTPLPRKRPPQPRPHRRRLRPRRPRQRCRVD